MDNKFIKFERLDIGARFFDPSSGEDYQKVSHYMGKFISGGNYFSGKLAPFLANELIQKIEEAIHE
jgi:hypothetical protein